MYGGLSAFRFHASHQPVQVRQAALVLFFHERRGEQEVGSRTVTRDRDVVDHGYAQQRLDVHVMRMRLERVPEKNHEVDSTIYDRGADLLIASQGSA